MCSGHETDRKKRMPPYSQIVLNKGGFLSEGAFLTGYPLFIHVRLSGTLQQTNGKSSSKKLENKSTYLSGDQNGFCIEVFVAQPWVVMDIVISVSNRPSQNVVSYSFASFFLKTNFVDRHFGKFQTINGNVFWRVSTVLSDQSKWEIFCKFCISLR